MSSKARYCLIVLVILSLALLTWARPDVKSDATMTTGKPDFQSVGQLTFGPDHVLFVADSLGTAVYAVDLEDQGKPPEKELPRISDLDEKVGALLGTTARDILIEDLAVHPKSKNIYLSVSRGRGDDAEPVLVKVDGTGKISLVTLDNAPYSKAMIKNAPAVSAKDRRGRSLRTFTITDIAYADGFVYVAGLSNEEFASNLRKIPYPFTGEMETNSVEIYHGAHGQYETRSPIRTFLPFEIDGEPQLLAAYTCTPLVTFSMKNLVEGQHVKGKTIAELGFGNSPLDMVRFNQDGKPYILVLNSSRGAMKIDTADIAKAEEITDQTGITRQTPLAGVPYLSLPMAGIFRADNYDDKNLVVLGRDARTGSLQLRLWPTQWL